jgi:3',5'-cyclic AMP phosphodiesterase CpdA
LEARGSRLAIATLGHISDLHATRVPFFAFDALRSKRLLGWLSWQIRRRRRYQPAVLEALIADLKETSPDQLAITGDLTQIALASELREAADWLARFGPPERVHAIPGNHDAYSDLPSGSGWELWSAYVAGDRPATDLRGAALDAFPSVRVRGELALVGVCTAQPTPPFAATGSVGEEQLARLDRVLEQLGASGLCRVILIHHPPVDGLTNRRRSLLDAHAFGDVLRRRGAELVLHGHLHRATLASLPGPDRPIPVAGVPSASHAGPTPKRCAAYHLYEIERARSGFAIRRRVRAWDPATRRFTARGSDESIA